MSLLAFQLSPSLSLSGLLLPLALYLLALGLVNRRATPLLLSGVLDFCGLVFAVSGFLFFAGPLVLDRLNHQIRLGWLVHPGSVWFEPARLRLLLGLLYFLIVAGVAALLLLRYRHLTSVYNVDLDQFEDALADTFEQLDLRPLRSGSSFFFRVAEEEAGTAPAVVLELELFPAFRHVGLRWAPAESPLRQRIEDQLARNLADSPTEPGDVSFWLILAGLFLLGLSLIALVAALIL